MTEEVEAPRKGKSNAILTYETVEAINLGIQEVKLGVKHLAEKVDDEHDLYIDHETRLRMLEKAEAGRASSVDSTKFIYQAIWPAAAFGMALLSYFSK